MVRWASAQRTMTEIRNLRKKETRVKIMENQLRKMVQLQAEGQPVGIYSVCSANEYVLRAALRYGKENKIPVLIEATANQVNQFGGYTDMTPKDFACWIRGLAEDEGIAFENVILGGDHLGPLVWRKENSREAMDKAEVLVAQFVEAGFQKIHIDTSMPLGTDQADGIFSHELVAQRSARLAAACEEAWKRLGAKDHPVYVVGSEVPVPGGAMDDEMAVTDPEQFRRELELFQTYYQNAGVDPRNIIGFVVQPGVEFTNTMVHYYDRRKAAALCSAKKEFPSIVFEGHSTDYQPAARLREMVEDGIGILKVGPALTNGAREGLFALEMIAAEMPGVTPVPFRQILNQAMDENDVYWRPYYEGTEEEVAYQKCFGMSDRCRYYLSVPAVRKAVRDLLDAFGGREIPLQMISQYLPQQLEKVQLGQLAPKAEDLLLDRIAVLYDTYHRAAGQMEKLGFL